MNSKQKQIWGKVFRKTITFSFMNQDKSKFGGKLARSSQKTETQVNGNPALVYSDDEIEGDVIINRQRIWEEEIN